MKQSSSPSPSSSWSSWLKQGALALPFAWDTALSWGRGLAILACFVFLNLLSLRFYRRYDFSSEALYSLSGESLALLDELDEEVDIYVFMASAESVAQGIQRVLESYHEYSSKLKIHWIDPAKQPQEFYSAQQKLRIRPGMSEDGAPTSRTLMALRFHDGERILIQPDALIQGTEGEARSLQVERAISTSLERLIQRESRSACFTEGHGEQNISANGLRGFDELEHLLEERNYQINTIPLIKSKIDSCDLLLMLAPTEPLSKEEEELLLNRVEAGAGLLFSYRAELDQGQRIKVPLTAYWAESLGITAQQGWVLEGEPKARLQGANGEIFFASASPHPLTQGLLEDLRSEPRVRIELVAPLEIGRGSSFQAVLESSEQASLFSRFDVEPPAPSKFVLLAAGEYGKGRMLFSRSSSLLWSQHFTESSFSPNQALVHSMLSWLNHKESKLNIPARAARIAALELSEEEADDLKRYVMLYIPLFTALIGVSVALRRKVEKDGSEEDSQPSQSDKNSSKDKKS